MASPMLEILNLKQLSSSGIRKLVLIFHILCLEKVTPAQIREAEKSLKIMEAMINVMTPGKCEVNGSSIPFYTFVVFVLLIDILLYQL